MAEFATGQQRSFVKNVSRQSAEQIREGATATVKALSDQVRLLGGVWRWETGRGVKGRHVRALSTYIRMLKDPKTWLCS